MCATSFASLLSILFPTLLLWLSDRVSAASLTCTGASIPTPSIFGSEVLNITAIPTANWQNISNNDICLITVTLTHPGTGDAVRNTYAFPGPQAQSWNNIFLGIGGGGFSAGTLTAGAPYTAQGYAIGSTDAGIPASGAQDASPWALLSPGNPNLPLLTNFARRSLHDMTVIGQTLAASFYGTSVARSYWYGCSTGGRQGLVLAEYYPGLYDGIIANAPAVQWNDFTLAQMWPFVVQIVEGYTAPPCELAWVVSNLIQACDGLDGLVDGMISAPALCNFQAQSLVGKSYVCEDNGSALTFSVKAAEVVDKILAGPQTPEGATLWWGLIRGANFTAVVPNIAGNPSAQPFAIADSWIRGFIAKDLAFNTRNISYTEFADIFLQGHLQYDSLMGSASPNLLPFKRRGGKIITWQGLADGTINPQGTMFYYQKVLALDADAAGFYRQFYSPGVGHCGGGTGVEPTAQLEQLRAWAENGTAPDTLRAASTYPVNASSSAVVGSGNVRFLDLCPWPGVNKYKGSGDPAVADSWECAVNTGWEDFNTSLNAENYSIVGGPGWYGSSFDSVEI
ncbi:hypothetical protein N0V82_003810 [Gnomoniopsis sp. IMI 355080]|nr:hypothetical protein N0V82_003810 [Gnomoniopsis sp. IMI 355080]